MIYDKEIRCKVCNSFNVSAKPAGAGRGGLLYCTCNVCDAMFIKHTDDSDIINRYVTSRQKLFAEVERASLRDGDYARVGTMLTSLADAFGTIVDIDPMYYWYKLEFITDGFTDLSREEDAATEYAKLPADRYFVSTEDATRNGIYEKRYKDYIEKCERRHGEIAGKRRKKRVAAVACTVLLAGAVAIGAGIFVGVHRPVVNTEAGVSVTFGNSSYGLFGKFRAGAEAVKVQSGSPEYSVADRLFAEASPKAELYAVSFTEGGVKRVPDNAVSFKIELNESFRKENVAVYEIREDGGYSEIKSAVNTAGFVSFESKHVGLFAVAEKPYAVTFDCNGGSAVAKRLVPWGECAVKPEEGATERAGYSFAGWSADGADYDFTAPVYRDVTLTAKWTPNVYTLSYLDNGIVLKTENVTFGEPFTLYEATKTGYTVEWYFNGEKAEGGYWSVADDASFTAKWVPKRYTLNLSSGVQACCQAVGAGDTSVKVDYGKLTPSVKAPVRTGYVFDGYYSQPDGEGEKYVDGDGSGSANWTLACDATLYANWQLDPEYAGFTYISTVDGLYATAGKTDGKYLLTCDLDMDGREWSPISFNGVFDGGRHSVYNFKITNGYVTGRDKNFGLFGLLGQGGTVKNLQVGKEGFVTSMSYKDDWWNWEYKLHGGMIAGFSRGTVYNCRVVGCSIDLTCFCQGEAYKNEEFYTNVAGVCGVQRGGSVRRCSVTGSQIKGTAKTRYNHIRSMARAGGIIGYAADGCLVSDCYVKESSVSATGYAMDGGGFNFTGAPYARAGGIIAEALNNATVTVCVLKKDVAVGADIKWGSIVDGGGNSYLGAMFGTSDNANLSNLIGVGTSTQCSGTTGNNGFSTIEGDVFNQLVAKNSAFANGSWYNDGGKIAVKFFED